MVASVARTFHVTPYQVARELDDDPETLNVVCATLLNYAEVLQAHKAAGRDSEATRPWKGSKLLEAVESNAMDLQIEKWHRQHVKLGKLAPGCQLCKGD